VTAATASATAEALARLTTTFAYESLGERRIAYTITARPGFATVLTYDEPQNRWTVAERETGIFGQGDTPSAAIADFQRAVLEHLDVLERQPALSDELAAQLEYLRERIGS
jgi:hypothetical protein